MAAVKKRSVYMVQVLADGVYLARWQYAGEWAKYASGSAYIGGDPTTFPSAKAARWLAADMRKAGVRTKIVRFMEVTT